ncbi:MAG: MFS transporter [Gammaproteobacteria bacterium]|nr:MAG: MFS transporter [Gammaproteobacteria bacterium]
MLFLGFSAGVPILLIFSSLSLWLREAGVEKSAVTFFSWAALGYSFKFIWAPLVDRLPVPVLTTLVGRRRAWLLLAQLAVMASILWMASIDPAGGASALTVMALAAVALGFSSATQDIVIDAYRIESGTSDLQAMMSSTYVAGYRIGMLVAGAGALFLAAGFGSTAEHYSYKAWFMTYVIMASVMLVGVVTTLLAPEPASYRDIDEKHRTSDHLRFLAAFVVAVFAFVLMFRMIGGISGALGESLVAAWGNEALAGFVAALFRLGLAIGAAAVAARGMVLVGAVDGGMVREAYLDPVFDFFRRHGKGLAILLLLIVGFYRVSDIVLGVIANVFYQDIGYTKEEIASVSKVFGLWMTISGGFVGGLMAMTFGVMPILFLGAVLSALTNLLFMLLAGSDASLPMLFVVIGADNLSAGLATAAFIAFLSSLTNVRFTAVQYAIFSSLMTLLPKVLGGYSGSMVESMGYSNFFLLTALMTVPVLLLLLLAWRVFDPDELEAAAIDRAES